MSGTGTGGTDARINGISADITRSSTDCRKVTVLLYEDKEAYYLFAKFDLDYVEVVHHEDRDIIRNPDAGLRIMVGECRICPGTRNTLVEEYRGGGVVRRYTNEAAPVAEASE